MKTIASFTADRELNRRLVEFQANLRDEIERFVSFRWDVVSVRVDYVAHVGELVEVTSTNGAVRVTLPTPSADNRGLTIAVLRAAGTGAVTVSSPGAEVGGAGDPLVSSVSSNRFVMFVSNGAAWRRPYIG